MRSQRLHYESHTPPFTHQECPAPGQECRSRCGCFCPHPSLHPPKVPKAHQRCPGPSKGQGRAEAQLLSHRAELKPSCKVTRPSRSPASSTMLQMRAPQEWKCTFCSKSDIFAFWGILTGGQLILFTVRRFSDKVHFYIVKRHFPSLPQLLRNF
jgi:hypothetical protein